MADSTFESYRALDLDKLRRKELGPRSFEAIANRIQDIKSLFDQIIEIVERTPSIPEGIRASVQTSVSNFISNVVKPIQEYDYQKDERNQFGVHNDITRRINELHNEIFSNQQRNILLLFAATRSFDISGVSDALNEVGKGRTVLEGLNKQQKEVLDSLRGKAGEKTVQDYSDIFRKQADKHSSFRIAFKPDFKFSIGAAYFWMLAAVLLVYIGLSNIEIIEKWFPMNSENSYVLIGIVVKRVALISFWIFLVAFSFRQYSINKHLSILNRHRQNALDSFRIFIESIGKEDPTARSQLMLQVAKAIYEQGSTGYLSNKSGDSKEPSIFELTRFIAPHQGGAG